MPLWVMVGLWVVEHNLPGMACCRSESANSCRGSEVHDNAAAGTGMSERLPVSQQVRSNRNARVPK